MSKYNNSCYINNIYMLLQFLLMKDKKEREKTFYFLGRGIPENIVKHFKNLWYLNTEIENEKGLIKYKKIYFLYKNLEKFIIKEELESKPIYMADNIEYSQFFLNHIKECYLLEDGCINYNKEILEKIITKEEKKNFRRLRDKFLKRRKKYYKPFGLSEKIKKIYLTGITEIPEIIKNKVEIISLKEKWKKLSSKEKDEILNIFDFNMEKFTIIEKLDNKVLIITQPLSEDEIITEAEKIELYKKIIEQYPGDNIIIKTHPREKTDYRQFFSKVLVINEEFPLELVALLGIEFKEIVTIFSTAAFHFKDINNVRIVGTEKIEKLKNRFGEMKEIVYKV